MSISARSGDSRQPVGVNPQKHKFAAPDLTFKTVSSAHKVPVEGCNLTNFGAILEGVMPVAGQ